MNEPLIFGLTEREVLLIFVSPLIVWAAKILALGWWKTVRTHVFNDWGRGLRFVVAGASGGLIFGLTGEPELSPRMTLLMIILCLACYWAVMTQREKNAQEAINDQKNRTAKDHEDQVTRQASMPGKPDQE